MPDLNFDTITNSRPQNRNTHDPVQAVSSLSLVVPPFIRPTSPPLGPASLKAYLKQDTPHTTVRCFDLNLDYIYLAMDYMENGTFKLTLYEWDHVETAKKVRQASYFLKNNRPSSKNIKEYHRQSTIFLSFENILNGFMSEMALRAYAGAPIPSGVEAFFEALTRDFLAERVDLVCISVLFDVQMPFALLIAKKVKETTEARVLLGGAKFGVEPDPGRLLRNPFVKKVDGKEYRVLARDFIDGIVSGEGELCISHIVKMRSWQELHSSPNLFFWQKGKVVGNKPAVVKDMDLLPCPDFSDFALDRYLCYEPVLPLLTARGCPWGKCVFCTHHHSYKNYRQRSINKVIKDIKYLQEIHGIRFINFFDEMIPPARLRKMAKEIISQHLNIRYSVYGKPIKNFDMETLKIIYDSGCRVILWGLESASQRILDIMKKGTRIDDVERVIRVASQVGIRNLVFVMFGFPGETKEEFLETVSFLEKNNSHIHALSKGTFVYAEGSFIAENPGLFGITEVKECDVPPFISKSLLYETEKGLSMRQTKKLFKENLKKMESIGITPRFGTYRDHLLFYTS